jgi:hypothetical protein
MIDDRTSAPKTPGARYYSGKERVPDLPYSSAFGGFGTSGVGGGGSANLFQKRR